MESAFLFGKAIPPSPADGNRRKWEIVCALCLRRKGLLLGRVAGVAAISCRLPSDEKAISNGRVCTTFWLLLGCLATDGTAGVARVDALSSEGTDEKTESALSLVLEIKKSGQFLLNNGPTGNTVMQQTRAADPLTDKVSGVLTNFAGWLDAFGETSLDHQTFFAGPIGGFAKSFYYRSPKLGIAAVAPIIFCEAFIPSARRLFHPPVRFPIADAHYAMGFAFLYETTSDSNYLQKAVHFLNRLVEAPCPKFNEYCWGYPFDWVTRNGTMKRQTPLITTTPYVYEGFL